MTTTSRVIRLPSNDGAASTDAPAAPSAPAAPASSGYLGHLSYEDRARALALLANGAGLRLNRTIAPEGSSLLPVGVEAQARMAASVDALPSLEDGLFAFRAHTTAQAPKDVTVPLRRVRMSGVNGGIYGDGQDPARALAYSARGFGHLAAFTKPPSVSQGWANALLALPSEIRADAFNWAAAAAHARGANEVTLRTHVSAPDDARARRVIRAVVSDRYSTGTDDLHVLDAVAGAIPKGAKLRITKGDDITSLEIVWPAMARQLKVGDVAQIALRVRNSETKAASLVIDGAVLQVLCFNFTTAWTKDEEAVPIRHVGEARRHIGRAIASALARIEPLVHAFADAYQNPLPGWAVTRGEVVARAVKAGILTPGLAESVAKGWDGSPQNRGAPDTLASYVNAMTWAAQDLPTSVAAKVQREAGRVVQVGWSAFN